MSQIKSTVNLNEEVITRIRNASQIAGIAVNEVVHRLLVRTVQCRPVELRANSAIQYQKGGEHTKWRRMHVTFQKDLHEKCHSLRYVSKMSVSLILAQAVDRYLDEMIMIIKHGEIEDKYHAACFIFSHFRKNVYSFSVFWGVPPKKQLLSHLK